MTKHVSESERVLQAMYNRKENQLKEAQETIERYKGMLVAAEKRISELGESNKLLCGQIHYLVNKKICND